MAAGNTYVAIAEQTLGSAAASVTFSSIPSTYTDLVLVVNAGVSSTQLRLQFNSDTGSNYSVTLIYGDGSSVGSVRSSNQTSANIGGLNTVFGTNIVHLNNYSNSTTYKTAISRYGFVDTYSESGAKVCLWRNTNAITTMLVFPTSGNFATGSTFTLYGIKAA